MKLLQFVPYFLPYPGGQERYIYNLSKYLVKMGHEVHIICSNYPRSKPFEKIDGITIERYSLLARPMKNPIALNFLLIPKKFREFDIIHIHNEHAFSSIISFCAKKIKSYPLVLTNHGQLRFGSDLLDNIEKIYMRIIGKRIFELSDIIAVNCESDKEFVTSIAPKITNKIYILHNSIDTDYWSVKLEKAKNMDFEKFEADFTILFVGVLIKRKGIEWLIKAINICRQKTDTRLKCVIVGEGVDRKYFESLVQNHDIASKVIFTGKVSEEKLAWLYNSSDLFVLPSLSEGCPTVVLEAMYFGLPVVSTDIPGIRDHFKGISILVPPKNEKALADAILMLMKDKSLRHRLSNNGTKLVKEKYRWDIMAKKYETIYKKLL
jgi:glycosyltransferase involved in cell wall biosynthesis